MPNCPATVNRRRRGGGRTYVLIVSLAALAPACGGAIPEPRGARAPSKPLSAAFMPSSVPAADGYDTIMEIAAETEARAACAWDLPGAKFAASGEGGEWIDPPSDCTVYAAFPGVEGAKGSVSAVRGGLASEALEFSIPVTGVPASGTVNLTRDPYVQNCSQTSLDFLWHTDVAARGIVGLGETEDADEFYAVGPADGATEHALALSGLDPGTSYYYKVFVDGREMFSSSVHTNPASDAPFVFAALGDSGAGGDNQYAVAAVMESFAPEFILHTGDVVYQNGEAEEYPRKFFGPYGSLIKSVCMFPVLGNHDQKTDNGGPYKDVFSLPDNGSPDEEDKETYYSFTYGNAIFIGLQAQGDRYPGGDFDLGDRQREWLEATLAATDKKWKIVFSHRPPYSAGREEPGDDSAREKLMPVLEQYGADLLLTGHDHNYQRWCPMKGHACAEGGPLNIVTGGGGMLLYAQQVYDDPRLAVFKLEYHAVKIEIDGDELTGVAINMNGETIDGFSITK